MGTVESGCASSARVLVLDDALRCHEAAVGGAQEQRVEEHVGAQHLPVAGAVGPVGVDDGGIEVQGRHGHQLDVGVGRLAQVGAAGAVGRAHEAELGVDGEDVGAQAGPGGQERHPPRRRLQPEIEHPLVHLHHLDPAVLAGGPPVRVERDGIEGDEPAHHLAHLSGGAQQTDVGAAVGDEGEIGQVRAAECPHDGHGLAARAPAADPDRHARAELADDVVHGGALVGHQAPTQILTGRCRRRASRRRRPAARRPRRARGARR